MRENSLSEKTPLIPQARNRRILIAVTLILAAHASSICSSVRYGFLVISCSKRDISGSIYGFIESSKLVGYIIAFFSKSFTEKLFSRFSPKSIIVVTLFGIVLTIIVSGVSIFSQSNLIFLALSISMRILQGYVGFFFHLAVLDLVHTLYIRKFDLLNGLLQLGYFSGHGIGQWMGAALYDHFGYFVPFAAASAILIVIVVISIVVLPPVPSYTAESKDDADDDDKIKKYIETSLEMSDSEKAKSYQRPSLTWLLIVPLISIVLVNCIYNVLQVFITPYLLEEFDIPLTIGGTVLSFASVGMGIGSVLSGMLAQTGILATYTQMTLGALMVAAGVLLVFPNPSLTLLHSHPLMCAFPAVFLASLGDPILTIPALKSMKEIQLKTKNVVTPKQSLKITAIWLVGSNCAMYMGSLMAGVFIDHLEMYQSAYVLACLCGVSMCCSIGLRMIN